MQLKYLHFVISSALMTEAWISVDEILMIVIAISLLYFVFSLNNDSNICNSLNISLDKKYY